ncbi:hypothetical protein [Ideonella sp. BN130291]|uniref:hypothetical protein n=1 Tax=Ideonella sp. BN130291 TaxID=3112940 RepID=UPI002E25584D|nr:hypothetical protein [Ideonella sp. BN130291]
MDKNSPPRHFNTFSPANHIVMALPSADAAAALQDELRDAGVAEGEVVVYEPQQMRALATDEVNNATLAAKIGQEYNLAKTRLALAEQGCTFVVTPIGDDRQVQAVAEAARRHGALRAQRYGTFLIEELVEVGDGERQVGESPDRGLDPQTTTGRESQPHERGAGR